MKRQFVPLFFLLLFALSLTTQGGWAQAPDTSAAQLSAQSWLSLVDSQNYGASWVNAASAFRARVTREQWDRAVRAARTPFGDLKSRTVKSVAASTTLPGAPDGEYVTVQFDTAFAQKAEAVETVISMRDTDREWHVAGYFVR